MYIMKVVLNLLIAYPCPVLNVFSYLILTTALIYRYYHHHHHLTDEERDSKR